MLQFQIEVIPDIFYLVLRITETGFGQIDKRKSKYFSEFISA